MLKEFLLVVFVVLVVRFVMNEALFQRARRVGSEYRFPVGIVLRIIFRLGGPSLVLTGIMLQKESSTRFDDILSIVCALMGLGCLLFEPGEIILTHQGLMQKKYFGLQKIWIPLENAAARYIPGLYEVLVIGQNGVAISHSRYHVGQEQFLEELSRNGISVQGRDSKKEQDDDPGIPFVV